MSAHRITVFLFHPPERSRGSLSRNGVRPMTSLCVEPGGGLVEEQDGRLVDEGAQDDGLPLPSPGEIAGELVQERGETDDVAELHHPGLELLARDAVQNPFGNDILADGDIHIEGQVLLADPDELPGAPGIHGHVVTVYDDPPGRGPAHGRHGAGGGGLPGPVGSQESVYLPAPDGETDVVDSGEITEPHRESFDHDYVVWHSLTFGVFTCPWCRAGR